MELDRTAGAGDRAARGPGLAGAQLFAERGARVALAEIAGGVAEQAAQRIRCDAIAPCDVTMPDDVTRHLACALLVITQHLADFATAQGEALLRNSVLRLLTPAAGAWLNEWALGQHGGNSRQAALAPATDGAVVVGAAA